MGSHATGNKQSTTDARSVTDNSGQTNVTSGGVMSDYAIEDSFSGIAGNYNQITGTDPGLLEFTAKILQNNAQQVSDIVTGALSTTGASNATVERLKAETEQNALGGLFNQNTIMMVAAIAGIAAAVIQIFGKGK